MSGNDDVVALEDDLTKALSEGGDAALAKALQDLAVTDDGKSEGDDGEGGDTNTGTAAANAGGGEGDPAAGKGGDSGEGGGGKSKPADDATAAAATKDDKSGAAAGGQDSQPGSGEEAPIQNKSGTGTIPYSVLSTTRQHAKRLEQDLAEANRKLEEAQQQLLAKPAAAASDKQQDGSTGAATANIDELSDEDFADLPPEVQKLHRTVKALASKLEQVGGTTAHIEQAHQQTVDEQIQSAIDGVPDLVEWQAKGGALWGLAVQIDQQLRADPNFASKTYAQRFEEVAKKVREEVGLPPRTAAAANTTTGQPDKKAAAAKAAAADVPGSLSEIPGGGAPQLDVHDSIEKTSATGLASRMQSMKDDDIDALLAKLS